jgi:alpha-N-arabinofuranosidase
VATLISSSNPGLKQVQENKHYSIQLALGQQFKQLQTVPITTALLGKAKVPELPYENADGSPIKIDSDFFGKNRSSSKPTSGPFEHADSRELKLKVW